MNLLFKNIIGIVYCMWQTISETFFNEFVLCPECMNSAMCSREMIMYIFVLCYQPIPKVRG